MGTGLKKYPWDDDDDDDDDDEPSVIPPPAGDINIPYREVNNALNMAVGDVLKLTAKVKKLKSERDMAIEAAFEAAKECRKLKRQMSNLRKETRSP